MLVDQGGQGGEDGLVTVALQLDALAGRLDEEVTDLGGRESTEEKEQRMSMIVRSIFL